MIPPYPRATYRLQLNAGFTFRDAAGLVGYLRDLGVSHLYTSPFLMARPGSQHGYDIVDHTRLNPEIGSEADLAALTEALAASGMGLILDFVPNHMGVMGADNVWWLDVLEWGESSPYAAFFDIDWHPTEPSLEGKVLLPVLGDHYGAVLESGGLPLRFDAERGTFSVWYHEHRLPVAVRDYAEILGRAEAAEDAAVVQALHEVAERFSAIREGGEASAQEHAVKRDAAQAAQRELARLVASSPAIAAAVERAIADYNGMPGEQTSFRALHALLDRQAYRIAYWRVAAHEINYRRFFDVTTLAGIRLENPELFEIVHQRVFQFAADHRIQGLRLDHIDGLWNPAAYCRHLQERLAHIYLSATEMQEGAQDRPDARLDRPFYVLVEKILAGHEHLREDWPVSGTTGYEFINLVNGLFVDPQAERFFTRLYAHFTGRHASWTETLMGSKRQIIDDLLASELNVVATQFYRVAEQSRLSRDYSLFAFRRALTDIASCFPVYRTYVTAEGASPLDRRDIERAVGRARKISRNPDKSIYDFVQSILTLDLLNLPDRQYRRDDVVQAAMKWQQFTAPVTAKSMEDTAFYRWVRLVSLNEVGGEPDRFGVSPVDFHLGNEERLRSYPFSMVTLTTHDHKRGADVRARINVLTEKPRAWTRAVTRWTRLNAVRCRAVEGGRAPSRNDEYLFYQTLVGAWPSPSAGQDWETFTQRLVDYMLKAVREAKTETAWTAADPDYESAVEHFVRSALSQEDNQPFLSDVEALVAEIGLAAAVNGLAQTALLLTVPGVPDCFQGCEFWDFSLVDPDNRKPVDFDLRRTALSASPPLTELLEAWPDGRVKQAVTARLLRHRARHPDLFARGGYEPLAVEGPQAEHVIAFRRYEGEESVIVIVPRLCAALLKQSRLPLPVGWEETAVLMPEPPKALVDLFTGRELRLQDNRLAIAEVLRDFPVAVLVPKA